ncbi:hypothetical protein AC579_8187, partial [Pseudocercospora musae]
DDDITPPPLSEEEHERVRQALRGSFGKNGKHSSSFFSAPAAGRVSQASRPTGISKMSASPAVASKPKQKRNKKEVVAVDAIADEVERAKLQREQTAMYDAPRAGLNARADRACSCGKVGQSCNDSASPSTVIDLTTPPHQQPPSAPYRPQSPTRGKAPSIFPSSSPVMGYPSEAYQPQSPGYRPFSPSFPVVDVFADSIYTLLLDDEELKRVSVAHWPIMPSKNPLGGRSPSNHSHRFMLYMTQNSILHGTTIDSLDNKDRKSAGTRQYISA